VQENRLPPRGLVRIEEMVNYFRYRYEGPTGETPFAVRADTTACPWEPRHRLVRIALKAREVEKAQRPPANLVFLVDVSGSMNESNKLPLVQQSIALLVPALTAADRISLVVYAGASGLVLPATPGDRHEEILAAINRLQAGGSTNGGAGIELAYKVASENFVPGGINRVLLATDGDFNVGVTNKSDLVDLIEKEAKSKVFLTALGYGMGNLKDSTLESLADKGNGNYGYVDSLSEARKVLVEEGMGTLQTVAKDVKIQVEWNPAKVAGYRLLGYENRMLAAQDFLDDAKDAGEMGAGHTVTALYEVVPAGEAVPGAAVEGLRYQQTAGHTGSDELLTVKCRYKDPEGDVSRGFEVPCTDNGLAFDAAGEDFRFAAAVAAFGLVLRDSQNKGSASLPMVIEIAASSLGGDDGGYRKEFLSLVEKALALRK
jgi:Ca-activated chloride channel family protein